MIELISGARCIDCDLCVKVCPTNVFDAVVGDHPTIARQSDCQTCFMCEAYCPTDAIFVAPQVDPLPALSPLRDERYVADAGFFGKYRRDLGWSSGQEPTARRASHRPLLADFAAMERPPAPAASAAPS